MSKQNTSTTTTISVAAATDCTAVPDTSHYRALHQAMRRSNERLAAALAQVSPADRVRTAALARWFEGYVAELRMHHLVEDEIWFPALAERVPTFADYSATLAGDHHHLDDVIDALGVALGRLADPAGDDADRAKALALATELRDFLVEHLGFEDDDVLPMFERHFSVEEYDDMDARTMKRLKPRQALFTAPWFMRNAPADVAAETLRDAPLPLQIVYRLGRRRYDRLAHAAFGAAS